MPLQCQKSNNSENNSGGCSAKNNATAIPKKATAMKATMAAAAKAMAAKQMQQKQKQQ